MGSLRLFLCGDVMTGRGIDQALPHPLPPRIYEPYIRNSIDYLRLAESVNGNIPSPVDYSYIWGDALELIRDPSINFRLINLETSITHNENYWKYKGINYRMNPENIPCLTVAGISCCSLANNHVLDWGYEGLEETLSVLDKAGISHTGAGCNLASAQTPALFHIKNKEKRILVFGVGSQTSGIPFEWAAEKDRAGINMVFNLSEESADLLANLIKEKKDSGDIVIISIHWGSNWGYEINPLYRQFVHDLIDKTGATVIHGHSSHHPRGVEIYKGSLILYGCGDFINDYEGISGFDEFRSDLTFMYLVDIEESGHLDSCRMIPFKIQKFRLNDVQEEDIKWLQRLYRNANHIEGTEVVLKEKGFLVQSVLKQG